MHHFYNGLSVPERTHIDASAGGAILAKNEVGIPDSREYSVE